MNSYKAIVLAHPHLLICSLTISFDIRRMHMHMRAFTSIRNLHASVIIDISLCSTIRIHSCTSTGNMQHQFLPECSGPDMFNKMKTLT